MLIPSVFIKRFRQPVLHDWTCISLLVSINVVSRVSYSYRSDRSRRVSQRCKPIAGLFTIAALSSCSFARRFFLCCFFYDVSSTSGKKELAASSTGSHVHISGKYLELFDVSNPETHSPTLQLSARFFAWINKDKLVNSKSSNGSSKD